MARNFLDYDYTKNTVADIFSDAAAKCRDKVFLRKREKSGWSDITWGETASQVEALASYLLKSGIQTGSIISIYSGNRPEWVVADLAIQSIACADAVIYQETSSPEAAQIVGEARSAICFCEGRAQIDSLLLRRKELPLLRKIIVFDEPDFKDDIVVSFSDALKEGSLKLMKDEIRERRKSIKGPDLMTVIYTSGIAGQSKGVMLSHANTMFTLLKYNMRQNLPEGHSVLSILPLSSASERIMGYYSTMLDCGTIAFSRGTEFFIQDMTEIKPHFAVFTPYYVEKIYSEITGKIRKASSLKQTLFNRAVETGRETAPSLMTARPLSMSQRMKYSIYSRLILNRLKRVTGINRITGFIVTGSPLSQGIHDLFWAMKILLRKCYGLTEASAILSTDGAAGVMHVKTGNWIMPFPETEMKTSVEGEILVKGPQIMAGYFNRPQESQDMFTHDGWFKTGDLGAMDVHGYVKITDRKKDMIITSSGRKIPAVMVEAAFRAHPLIEQIAVFGDSRKHLGALIVPDYVNLKAWAAGMGIISASEEELLNDSRITGKFQKIVSKLNRISGFEETVKTFKLLPQGFTYRNGELTPSLRIKRKVIAVNYSKEIESLFNE